MDMRMGSEEVISYDTKPAGDVVPTSPLQSCFNVGYNSTKNTLLFFQEFYNIPYDYFVSHSPRLYDHFMKWGKTYSKKNKIFLETFNDEKWIKMADNKKQMHCLNNCQGSLLDYRNIMSDLPMTKYWGSISKNPLDDLHSNMSRSQLNNITNKIYNRVNESSLRKRVVYPLQKPSVMSKILDYHIAKRSMNVKLRDAKQ